MLLSCTVGKWSYAQACNLLMGSTSATYEHGNAADLVRLAVTCFMLPLRTAAGQHAQDIGIHLRCMMGASLPACLQGAAALPLILSDCVAISLLCFTALLTYGQGCYSICLSSIQHVMQFWFLCRLVKVRSMSQRRSLPRGMATSSEAFAGKLVSGGNCGNHGKAKGL